MQLDRVISDFRALADGSIAEHSSRFFKTGKGEYGEGDVFLGIRVPAIRAFAKRNKDLSLPDTLLLLTSEYHEERLLALVMLVNTFEKSERIVRRQVYQAYLKNTRYINNWDLVDSSAHQIVGGHLFDRSRVKLLSLAKSKSLWERRISIIATYHFIKQQQFDDTLSVATLLLNDEEDLIHKAVGWMLRETGNRNKAVEVEFLKKHYSTMPRTMLRYAIEKFPEAERKRYLDGEISQR